MLFSFRSRIQSYTVHEKPDPQADRDERAEELFFVRDGFSFAAFLVAPFWMLSKAMWLPFVIYLCLLAFIILVVTAIGLDTRWAVYAVLAVHMLVGFEADSLQRWSLDRKGWRMISSVAGATFEECERRFFDHWLRVVPAVATANLTPPGAPGGLGPESLGRQSPPPYTGDVLPPKRTGWRSGFSFSKRG